MTLVFRIIFFAALRKVNIEMGKNTSQGCLQFIKRVLQLIAGVVMELSDPRLGPLVPVVLLTRLRSDEVSLQGLMRGTSNQEHVTPRLANVFRQVECNDTPYSIRALLKMHQWQGHLILFH